MIFHAFLTPLRLYLHPSLILKSTGDKELLLIHICFNLHKNKEDISTFRGKKTKKNIFFLLFTITTKDNYGYQMCGK